MISQFGPLQEPFISQWPRFHIYFRPNGEQLNSMVDGSETKLTSYDDLRFEEKSFEIDEKEEEIVIDLLQSALRYEPDKRPSAKDLLSHP